MDLTRLPIEIQNLDLGVLGYYRIVFFGLTLRWSVLGLVYEVFVHLEMHYEYI